MTTYRLANGADDHNKAMKLLKDEGLEQDELSFPTVMAWKDEELTGFISTHISNNLVCAGPLVIKSGAPRYWTLIRLIEHYENVMRSIGITSYIFSVEVGNYNWLSGINRLFEFEPYAEQNERKFFIRNI